MLHSKKSIKWKVKQLVQLEEMTSNQTKQQTKEGSPCFGSPTPIDRARVWWPWHLSTNTNIEARRMTNGWLGVRQNLVLCIKLFIMSIRMLHVCFDTSNVSCYPVSWRWLWDATYLISKKSNHNVVWEARTLQSNQSMVPTDQSHSLDRSLGKAPESGGHLPWKLVTGLCLSAAWMLFFLVPFCLGKKNPFNFPLPALFSQFLDACCLRKWWRHPASTCSNLFQSRRLATAIVLENPLASCATMRPGVNAICYEPPLESR